VPSSVCSFARFVSLPPFHFLSLSFSLSHSRPHLHTQRRTRSNGGNVRPPSCNQPARAATVANQQRRRSFVVMKNRNGNGERCSACCHDSTAKLTVIVDPHRRDPRRSCRTPFFPLHHRSVIARRS